MISMYKTRVAIFCATVIYDITSDAAYPSSPVANAIPLLCLASILSNMPGGRLYGPTVEDEYISPG